MVATKLALSEFQMNALNVLDPKATLHTLPPPPNGEKTIATYVKNYSVFDNLKAGELDVITIDDLSNLSIHLHQLKAFAPVKVATYNGFINTRIAKMLNYLLSDAIFGVEQIDLNRCTFAKDSMKIIFSHLRHCHRITDIKFSRTNLDNKDLIQLSQSLYKFPNLQYLDISYNQFTIKGMAYLFKVLNSKKVGRLDLTGNVLGKELGDQLQKFLNSNRYLTQLDININRIGGTGIDRIGTSLIFNQNLTHLNLVQNGLNGQACLRLASCLEHNEGVTHLDLSYNVIRDDGLASICKMLKVNRSIKYINLQHCGLGSDSGQRLGSMLRINRTLRGLDCSKNRLQDDGIWSLSRGLANNTSLFMLNLEENMIGEEGFVNLIKSIHNHPTLQNLNIKSLTHPISPPNQELLVQLVQKNNSLKVLSMDYTFNQWELTYSSVCRQLTRNFMEDHYSVTSALTVLYYMRVLFLTKSPKTDTPLPNEMLFEIIKQFDHHNKLRPKEWRSIMRYALDRSTIGQTKMHYLSQIFDDSKLAAYQYGLERDEVEANYSV